MYGSLFNRMMEGSKQPEPEVGMGATLTFYTDRNPATVVKVERFKSGDRKGQIRKVVVREDRVTRTDSNGMSECQEYAFEPDPNGKEHTFYADKRGRFKGNGHGIAFGFRDEYHDFSF